MGSLIGSLLGDAGYHLPLALPAFLTGVLVVVQLCSVTSGHPLWGPVWASASTGSTESFLVPLWPVASGKSVLSPNHPLWQACPSKWRKELGVDGSRGKNVFIEGRAKV